MIRLFVVGLMGCLISGCSHFSQDFSCGVFPTSSCEPVSEVYKKTSGHVDDYRLKNRTDGNNSGNKKRLRDRGEVVVEVGEAHRVMNYMHPGDPLLTKPVVLRVLYNGFKTEENDYDAGGYVFIRMKDSTWAIEN